MTKIRRGIRLRNCTRCYFLWYALTWPLNIITLFGITGTFSLFRLLVPLAVQILIELSWTLSLTGNKLENAPATVTLTPKYFRPTLTHGPFSPSNFTAILLPFYEPNVLFQWIFMKLRHLKSNRPAAYGIGDHVLRSYDVSIALCQLLSQECFSRCTYDKNCNVMPSFPPREPLKLIPRG